MDTGGCVLACFGAAGFSDRLRRYAAEHDDVRLVGPAELYA